LVNCTRTIIIIGDKFSSFEEFSKSLEIYKKKNANNDYWIRDSRTLTTQIKRFPESRVSQIDTEKLIYYYLRISYIKGARKHVSKSKSRKTFTFKQDCQVGMFIKPSSCMKYFEVKEINNKT
jgi:predicted aconitase